MGQWMLTSEMIEVRRYSLGFKDKLMSRTPQSSCFLVGKVSLNNNRKRSSDVHISQILGWSIIEFRF